MSRLSWWASRHLDQDIAQAVLTQWVLALPLGDPRDPWGPEHVSERLDRAYAKFRIEGAGNGRAAGLTPGNGLVEKLNVSTDDVVEDNPPSQEKEGYHPSAFCQADQLVFPDLAWVVEDFIATGNLTEIIGKIKKGKSTLAFQLIASCLTGEPFLGRAVVKGPVVLLTEQTGPSLRATLSRAGLLNRADLHVATKVTLRPYGGWVRTIRAAIWKAGEVGARLIVVDTLSRLAGLAGDEENSSGAVWVLDVFKEAAAVGVAALFIRHARKGTPGIDDDNADFARGSASISAEMDVRLFWRPVHEEDLRRLTWESRISDDPEEMYLKYDAGTYTVVDKPDGKAVRNRDERREKVKAALLKLGEDASDRAVAEEVGLTHPTVAKYRRLLEKGKVTP